MLDFNNTKIAFSSKSVRELRNAYLLFSIIKYPWFVKLSGIGVKIALKIHMPLGWAVKPTLYKQFIGGETLKDCNNIINNLIKHNIYSTLDYSAEGKQTQESIENVFKETIRSIDFAKDNKSLAYAVFKPSTITTEELLTRASENHKALTEEEITAFNYFKERFMALCQRACENNVRLLVDAEEYRFQDIFDELTDEAMRKFNRQRAIVFTTLQMYRIDRLDYLHRIFNDAKDRGYIAGVKFVRGAYMEAERERAIRLGYPNPICKDKQATNENFDTAISFTIDNLEHFEMFMGTHNEDSNYKLAFLIDEKGIKRDDKRIFFAQLLGMSDNISFNLASEGYNVAKYVPYATVNDALPYLLRRAQENSFVSGQTGRELSMIKSEIERRKTSKNNIFSKNIQTN